MIQTASDTTQGLAAEIIRRGGLIAFRTDTFYGLGVDPSNQTALQALRNLKGREAAKPILLLISDAGAVDRFLAFRSSLFELAALNYWPGPLTLVGQAVRELPEALTAGTNTIGIRLPSDATVRKLVRACGGALTATSANPAGEPPARTAEQVAAYFPKGIDLIIDDGDVGEVEASTVLDVSGTEPRLIREGAITHAELLKSFTLKQGSATADP